MQFPIYHIPYLGNGFTIGMEAVIHVILSHGFAVGAFALIVLCEYIGYRDGSAEWEAFSRRYMRFSVIVITSVGAVTGVGIWFFISTIAPRGTGSMLRLFFWPWFTEWFFFTGEVVVLVTYYYLWDKWTGALKRRHIMLGASYSVWALGTAFLIAGIISFMLTSDGWPWSGSFMQAFFNPSFLPHLLLRLTGATALGALISLCYLLAIRVTSGLREQASRLFGNVLVVATIATAVFAAWYYRVVPSAFKIHAIAAVMPSVIPKDPAVFWIANIAGLILILALGFSSRRFIARILIIPCAIVAFGFVAEFEYIREFIRGPYLMPGYMYANQVLINEKPFLEKQGSRASGEFLFGRNCSSCHTMKGINNLPDRISGRSEDGIAAILGHIHEMVPWMPPFSGTSQEREVLARYLFRTSSGQIKVRESARLSELPEGPNKPDLLLKRPLSNRWTIGLLFVTFSLHMVFVLFMVGTGILGVCYYANPRTRRLGWDKEILNTFLAHKSLAVVLGVGPLLLMQAGFTVPFLTSINLLSPAWMIIIALLIVAFVLLEVFGQLKKLALGIIGIICLLAVPGIFAAVLMVTENPGRWHEIVQRGYNLPTGLLVHWLFRYLHVLGAAIVFGGVFHYLVSKDDRKKESLFRWVTGGLLFQILIGVMLFSTTRPDRVTNITLFIGVAAVVVLMWVLSVRRSIDSRAAPGLLGVLLIFMLLTRQFHQNQGVVPLQDRLSGQAKLYQARLQPYAKPALDEYRADLNNVPAGGAAMYARSCAFCHGANGMGDGAEAQHLGIPPEHLAEIRTTRPYLIKTLRDGVHATAMPFFSIYTTDKLDSLMDYLDQSHHILSAPARVTIKVPDAAATRAAVIYGQTCVVCHGPDGRDRTAVSGNLAPPPPDLTSYALQPDYAFYVITNGYRGTQMPSFRRLPEDVRWGLVSVVQGLYSR